MKQQNVAERFVLNVRHHKFSAAGSLCFLLGDCRETAPQVVQHIQPPDGASNKQQWQPQCAAHKRGDGYDLSLIHISAGCLLGSTFTMIVSLEFAKRLHPVSNLICLAAASILILRLAPANNAALHLNAEELVAVRKEVKLRLAIVMLSACLLLFFREPIAYRVTSAILALSLIHI